MKWVHPAQPRPTGGARDTFGVLGWGSQGTAHCQAPAPLLGTAVLPSADITARGFRQTNALLMTDVE